MDNTSTDCFLILESSLNYDIQEEFEIQESKATFSHKSFLKQIKAEMKYYSITIEMLAKSIYITNFRIGCLLNGNAEFTQEEIKKIRTRLNF